MEKKALLTSEQQSTVFLSNKDDVFRIPALFFDQEKKVLLAFAEKRRTSNDASAEMLVMKTGTVIKDETTHEISVKVIIQTYCFPDMSLISVWLKLGMIFLCSGQCPETWWRRSILVDIGQ